MTHFRVRFIKWLAVLISKLASRRISRDLLQFVGVAGVVNEPHVMPENISTAEFIREAWDDYNSPPTSTFSSRVGHCRSTVGALEEVGLVLLLGRVHTCSGREPDSSVLGARVRFASTRAKNRPAANRSRPVKLILRVHTATGTVPGLA